MARNQTQDPEQTPKVEAPSVPPVTDGDIVGQSIQRADSLLTAKRQIQSDLQVSRDFLHGVASQGLGTDEQRAWIEYHLPKRSRNRNGNGATAPDSE